MSKQSQKKGVVDFETIQEQQQLLLNDFNENFEKMKQDYDWEMGIDEAGRGPVFGPMVYSGLIWPIKYKDDLKKLGFDDSKKLTKEQRDQLFLIINTFKDKYMHFELDVLMPQFLSNQSLAHNQTNLNQISHNSAMGLITKIIQQGFNLKIVYLDTVGPKLTYQQKLEDHYKNIKNDLKFVVSEKADSLFPVVSAASICAKVTRDEYIENWKFVENIEFSNKNIGSGYPSDPFTKKWLSESFIPIFGYPTLCRFSWKTTTDAMKEKGLEIEYMIEGGELEKLQQKLAFQTIQTYTFGKMKIRQFQF